MEPPSKDDEDTSSNTKELELSTDVRDIGSEAVGLSPHGKTGKRNRSS